MRYCPRSLGAVLTAALVACGGADNNSSASSGTTGATSGATGTSGSMTTSTTMPTSTTQGSQSASGTTGSELTMGLTTDPEPVTGPASGSTEPVTTVPDTGMDTGVGTTDMTGMTDGTSDGTTSTTTAGPGMCPPVEGQDLECKPCSLAHCCVEEEICMLDLDCNCIFTCLEQGNGLAFCAAAQCNVPLPQDHPKIVALSACRGANCMTQCFP